MAGPAMPQQCKLLVHTYCVSDTAQIPCMMVLYYNRSMTQDKCEDPQSLHHAEMHTCA